MSTVGLACVGMIFGMSSALMPGDQPAAHHVKLCGTIRAVERHTGTVWIETPRQLVAVAITDETRIRIGVEPGRVDALQAGQTVSCLNQWRDGGLLCQELVVLRFAGDE